MCLFVFQGGLGSSAYREASSLTYTSLFLKQESDSWDPKDNRIVQVTRKMADKIFHMTQYLRKKGPILVRPLPVPSLLSWFCLIFPAIVLHSHYLVFRIKTHLSQQPKT